MTFGRPDGGNTGNDPVRATMKTLLWIVLATLCLGIGLYPLLYLLVQGKIGLLQSKSDNLLADGWWRLGFYGHIVTGGIALLVGWTQFIKA